MTLPTLSQWIEDGMPPIKDVVRTQVDDVPFKSGLPAVNDGAAYKRTPAHDTFGVFGQRMSNAWLEVASGRTVHFSKGYDANARRWLHIDDVEGRARIDGAAQQGGKSDA